MIDVASGSLMNLCIHSLDSIFSIGTSPGYRTVQIVASTLRSRPPISASIPGSTHAYDVTDNVGRCGCGPMAFRTDVLRGRYNKDLRVHSERRSLSSAKCVINVRQEVLFLYVTDATELRQTNNML